MFLSENSPHGEIQENQTNKALSLKPHRLGVLLLSYTLLLLACLFETRSHSTVQANLKLLLQSSNLGITVWRHCHQAQKLSLIAWEAILTVSTAAASFHTLMSEAHEFRGCVISYPHERGARIPVLRAEGVEPHLVRSLPSVLKTRVKSLVQHTSDLLVST